MKRNLFIVALMLLTLGVAAQVTVESKIDSIQILIGEQADLTLTVTARKGASVKLPSYGQSQYLTPGVEVVNMSDADTVRISDSQIRVTRRYTLTSFDEKLYFIPPMPVTVDGRQYKSQNLALKVLTIPVDTLHPEKFFPPKDVQDNPFLWSEWALAFWMSVLFVIVAVFSYYLWTRLKQNKPVIARIHIIKRVPPHQKALNEIEHIKGERMSVSDDQKAYYTMLTDVLRKYIKERFGFNALEMTSSEIIDKLQAMGDKKMIDELKELFTTADLVKFAKYSTLINENDANLVNAVEFINTTKQDTAPTEERVVPKLTEADWRKKKTRLALKITIGVLVAVSVALLCTAVYQVYLLL